MNYSEFATVTGSEKPYQPQPYNPSYDTNNALRKEPDPVPFKKMGGKKTRGKRRTSKRRR